MDWLGLMHTINHAYHMEILRVTVKSGGGYSYESAMSLEL